MTKTRFTKQVIRINYIKKMAQNIGDYCKMRFKKLRNHKIRSAQITHERHRQLQEQQFLGVNYKSKSEDTMNGLHGYQQSIMLIMVSLYLKLYQQQQQTPYM